MKWKQEHATPSAVEHQSPVFSPVSAAGEPDQTGAPARDGRGLGVWLTFVLSGLALAVVIFLVLTLTRSREEAIDLARIERLETRLEEIQEDITRIDATLDKFAGIETQVADLDRSQADTRDRLARLAAETTRIRKSSAALRQQLRTTAGATTLQPDKQARSAKAAVKSPKTIYHRVRRGDTLYAIARRYGSSVKRLRRDNHLGPKDRLHPGQVLRIRVP